MFNLVKLLLVIDIVAFFAYVYAINIILEMNRHNTMGCDCPERTEIGGVGIVYKKGGLVLVMNSDNYLI